MLGMIGCGNMAQAMLSGILDKGIYTKDDVIVSRRDRDKLSQIADRFGVHTTTDNNQVVQKSDTVMLCVKPSQYTKVIHQIRDDIDDDKLIISIAAGCTIDNMLKLFGKKVSIIRTMPNTPALVSAGATGMCFGEHVSDDDIEKAIKIFSSFGIVSVVSEDMMDTVVGVSGSSPAMVFMLIEAMADAAVADGMSRTESYRLAAQSVYGSAKLVLETGNHPAKLKDMVCSPAGTTIEQVAVLEKAGLRSAVIEGQRAAVKKAKEMSGE